MERALFHMENSYSVANVRGCGFVCRTNLPSNTAFRGFGGPQSMLVAESWMTDVAQSLGLPAEEVGRPDTVGGAKSGGGAVADERLSAPAGAPAESLHGRGVDSLQPGPGEVHPGQVLGGVPVTLRISGAPSCRQSLQQVNGGKDRK